MDKIMTFVNCSNKKKVMIFHLWLSLACFQSISVGFTSRIEEY